MSGATGGNVGAQMNGARVTNPLPGQALVYDGHGWVNGTASGANTVNVTVGDITGDGSITSPLGLATTAVTPGTYSMPSSIDVDDKGRLTSVSGKVPYTVHAVCAKTSNNLASSTSQGTLSYITLLSPFNSVLGSAVNAATGIYTAPASGFYSISFSLTFPASAAGYRSIQINSGVVVLATSGTSAVTASSTETLSCSCIVYLLQGEAVSFTGQQNSGGTQVLTAYRSLYYLGPE